MTAPLLSRAGRVAVAVLAVMVLVVDVFVLTQRNVTTPITRNEALRRFRSARAQEEPQSQASSTTTSSTALTSADARSAPAPGRAPSRIAAAAGTPSALPASGQTPYTLPAEGVYAYRTTGGESISVASHTYPAETFASVRHAGGCQWKNEFDVAEENVDTRTMCSDPGRLLQLEDRRAVTFFGVTESEDLHCDPAMVLHDVTEAPGAALSDVCRSSDTTAYVQSTYVGREAVAVGSVSVDAVHLSAHGVLKGRADGTADEQLWVLPQTGLVLRWERLEDAEGHAAFGSNVHYHEHSTFVLESLTPSM